MDARHSDGSAQCIREPYVVVGLQRLQRQLTLFWRCPVSCWEKEQAAPRRHSGSISAIGLNGERSYRSIVKAHTQKPPSFDQREYTGSDLQVCEETIPHHTEHWNDGTGAAVVARRECDKAVDDLYGNLRRQPWPPIREWSEAQMPCGSIRGTRGELLGGYCGSECYAELFIAQAFIPRQKQIARMTGTNDPVNRSPNGMRVQPRFKRRKVCIESVSGAWPGRCGWQNGFHPHDTPEAAGDEAQRRAVFAEVHP
jgi:hypothetical protein